MFSAYDIGLFSEKLKSLDLGKLTKEQVDDLMNCVGILDAAMITITSASIDLNNLNTKLKLIPDTVDINTAIDLFTQLSKELINGSKEIINTNLTKLIDTRIAVVNVYKFLNSFEPLKQPKIILLS